MASARTTPSENGAAGPSTAFKCNHEGCNKTFTRKDHLLRHQANHSNTIHTCPNCGRPFKRLDLLQRHEKRNVCTENADGSTAAPIPWTGRGSRRGKRARSTSSSSSSQDDTPAKSKSTKKPGNYIPPPSSGLDVAMLTGFDMFEGWDTALLPQDAWYPSLTNGLAGPYNEPIPQIDMGWDITMTRTQESAARGQQLMASAGLAAKLQAAYPGFDLSLSTIVDYLHLYWTHIAPSFPFIHRGTLDLDSAPLYLVILILIDGSVHSTNRQDFAPLVAEIRSQLVRECGSDAPVSIFQAFALCHIFDTWFGTQESMFVAQCVWSMVVSHSRKKGIGVQGGNAGDGEDELWSNWAKAEERRRAAYCVLMIDTHTSAFWHQHPARQLSIFAHDLPLPCSRSQWEATSASDWSRALAPNTTPTSKRNHRNAYLPGLHPDFRITQIPDGYSSAILSAMVAQADLQFVVDLENSLSVEMVLLGLMGTAWDHRTKGGMGIKFKDGAKHWRKLTQEALIHLRATWEGATQHITSCTETRDLRDNFGICVMSVLSDIPMLLAVAGASTVCGSTLTANHYADAKKRCRIWVKSDDAFTCLWQSARYLKQALMADWGLYTPLAAFLTTLVLYAYATTSPTTPTVFPHPSSNSSEPTNALLDTILASNNRPELSREPLLDLLVCVAKKISTHSELDKTNAALLWRLVEEHTGLTGLGKEENTSRSVQDGRRGSSRSEAVFQVPAGRIAREQKRNGGAQSSSMTLGSSGSGSESLRGVVPLSGVRNATRRGV